MKIRHFLQITLAIYSALALTMAVSLKAQNIENVTTTFGSTRLQLAKTNIQASRERVFSLISDLQQWQLWVAHETAEPNFSKNFSTHSTGVGATYEWKGSGEAGEGAARVLHSEAPTRFVVGVDFRQPVAGRLEVVFAIRQEGAQTAVEIETSGPAKLISYFKDKFLEHGLMRLACVAEASTTPLCELMMKGLK